MVDSAARYLRMNRYLDHVQRGCVALAATATLVFSQPALAQHVRPGEGICARQGLMYVGFPFECWVHGGEVLWNSVATPTDQEVIRIVQFGLKALGYDPGPVDGDFGPKTRAASNQFEASYGGTSKDDDLVFVKRLFGKLEQAGHFKRLDSLKLPQNNAQQTQKATEPPKGTEGDAWRNAGTALVRLLARLRR